MADDPLKQRDQLVHERQAAYDTYAEQTKSRQRAEHQRTAAERKLHTLQSMRATGNGTDAGVAKAQQEVDAATTGYDNALDRANIALGATKRLENALNELYSQEFPVFAEEAELFSKRADAALDAFVDAYRRAQEAWATAVLAWTPLCHSVRIANMPAFPLTDTVMAPVIQGWDARPPAIEVLDVDDDEAVEMAAELEGLDVAG